MTNEVLTQLLEEAGLPVGTVEDTNETVTFKGGPHDGKVLPMPSTGDTIIVASDETRYAIDRQTKEATYVI